MASSAQPPSPATAQPAASPLSRWERITGVPQPQTWQQWLALITVWQDLAVFDDAKISDEPIRSILDDAWSLTDDTLKFARRQTAPSKLRGLEHWADGAQYQIDHLQNRGRRHPRALLVTGAALLLLFVTIPQGAIAVCLQEWNTAARACADHGRTVFMFFALANLLSINLPLVLLFAQNRLIGSVPSILFYAIPAFYQPRRYLYHDPHYVYWVIPALLVWLVWISFTDHIRIASTNFSTRKEPHLTGEALAEATTLLQRWRDILQRLNKEIDAITTSDLTGQIISLIKKNAENVCASLERAIGPDAPPRPAQTHYPRTEKVAILVAAIACMLADILSNLDKPFFMTEKVAINIWITARLSWCAYSLYQSKKDILKLCCDLISGPTLSLFLVTPAKTAGLFATPEYLPVLAIIHVFLVFVFARHVAILYRGFGKLVLVMVRAFTATIHFSSLRSRQTPPNDAELPVEIREHMAKTGNGVNTNTRWFPLFTFPLTKK